MEVCGLNDGEKRLEIQNLLRGWIADVICLQETKMGSMFNHVIGSIWWHLVDMGKM